MTRRAILATLAAAALTACSGGTTIVTSQEAGSATDAGTDDAAADDGSTPPTCPVDPSSDGPVTGYPQGTWKAAGDYIIGHDATGLFAFSTKCTHEGCTISAPSSTGATSCPCHGARFDGNGAVTLGPARTPLPHFALTVCGGNVYVDTATVVAATTRTPAT